MNKRTYTALVDCNNFFVSCERLFRPELGERPVVVLSNNDGCVVARSNEVKRMGIPMGAPYFQVKDSLKQKGVTVFSGNFSLYNDLSKRVMSVIDDCAEEIEVYSIDESFVTLRGDKLEVERQAREIKKRVERGTGIPVSIGVSSSKTLAKLASEKAKSTGVFMISEDEREAILRETDVGEIWGVGRQLRSRLSSSNIVSALALAESSDQWLRATLGLSGLRVAYELRGVKALSDDHLRKDKKAIISSRSFGKKTRQKKDLEESVAHHITNAARKMRKQCSAAKYVSVTISVQERSNKKSLSGFRDLLYHTNDSLELIKHAHDILSEIYQDNSLYCKAGVLLSDFTQIELAPEKTLFEDLKTKDRKELMDTLDTIEKKHGQNALFSAAVGIRQSWSLRSEFSSPAYTTQWKSLPSVKTSP
ncbi:MAG: Y-family DNA polymerase [Candidatus Campbellbacteria bacterium]|nr:Y-family DNA polymerase [Candidatus Campbellbacteria bacterium]